MATADPDDVRDLRAILRSRRLMPRLAPVHWETFEKFLLRAGCVLKRREASHRVYWKDGLLRPIILQAKGNVPIFIILNNLRTLGMTRDYYLRILASL